MSEEYQEDKLQDGMFVYTDKVPKSCGYLTSDRKYEVFDVCYPHTVSFYIIDDKGDEVFCLLEGCSVLEYEDWKIFKTEEVFEQPEWDRKRKLKL